VILKELVDNALDGAEEHELAPEIAISVSTATGEIVIADNGPGIPADTVLGILDYNLRVSSREAYVSPTRGAQGNALKTIIAMPFALDSARGEVSIEACGLVHSVTFWVEPVRQEPRITHQAEAAPVKTGTRITVQWPLSACSILAASEARFLQMAADFAWLNPHLTLTAMWDYEERIAIRASNPRWRKWRASDSTPAHWYEVSRFKRYMAAHIARDEDHGTSRTVREFIAELRGLSGTTKQKTVLEEVGAARLPLAEFFAAGDVAGLLNACKRHTRQVKASELGLIGEDHQLALFAASGAAPESFKYQKALGCDGDIPFVIETAFGWCPEIVHWRRIITGVNWSVSLGNPFRSIRRFFESLDSLLAEQRAGPDEPIIVFLHYASPRIEYTDRGKTAISLPGTVRW
jgi:hypothetical protein